MENLFIKIKSLKTIFYRRIKIELTFFLYISTRSPLLGSLKFKLLPNPCIYYPDQKHKLNRIYYNISISQLKLSKGPKINLYLNFKLNKEKGRSFPM